MIVLLPLGVLGTMVGVILHSMFPNFIIELLFSAFLLFVSIKMLMSGCKKWKAESKKIHARRLRRKEIEDKVSEAEGLPTSDRDTLRSTLIKSVEILEAEEDEAERFIPPAEVVPLSFYTAIQTGSDSSSDDDTTRMSADETIARRMEKLR